MSKVTKELSGDLEDKILTLTFRRHLKSHFGEVAATFSSITLLYPSLSGSRRFPGSIERTPLSRLVDGRATLT